jgi:hypothetical protein
VCGVAGHRRLFRSRGTNRTCIDIVSCTERVMNPPVPVSTGRPYTMADIEDLRAYPQRYITGIAYAAEQARERMDRLADSFAKTAEAFAALTEMPEGFIQMGHLTDGDSKIGADENGSS